MHIFIFEPQVGFAFQKDLNFISNFQTLFWFINLKIFM
jgi:hypothetical protein